jgi:hypothetical protein
MRVVALICALILAAAACGEVAAIPDAAVPPASRCVLGASQIGHCTLGQ